MALKAVRGKQAVHTLGLGASGQKSCVLITLNGQHGIGGDPAFAERFAREAKALAKLNHPGIVTIYDSGRTDGLSYFLMEFVDGVSLGRLPPDPAVGTAWSAL